jgi:hypothetical protein
LGSQGNRHPPKVTIFAILNKPQNRAANPKAKFRVPAHKPQIQGLSPNLGIGPKIGGLNAENILKIDK